MTEEEYWLNTKHPEIMLQILPRPVSDRKLRLFTCTCGRSVEKVFSEFTWSALAVAERYADSLVSEDERTDALRSVIADAGGAPIRSRHGRCEGYTVGSCPLALLCTLGLAIDDECLIQAENGRLIFGPTASREGGSERARLAAKSAANTIAIQKQKAARGMIGRVHEHLFRLANRIIDGHWPTFTTIDGGYFQQVEDDQCALLRDIFGNPFRPARFSTECRTDAATALASLVYESRDFSAMPILADALQDAGCDNEDVLNHCRDAHQTHARGCWVVDLVLGKV